MKSERLSWDKSQNSAAYTQCMLLTADSVVTVF